MSNPLKKTMVYLGLADEELEYEEVEPDAKQTPVAPTAAAPTRAPVTPLRRATTRGPAATPLNEILTVHPKQYRDAQVIAENFRDGVPVIINLSQMDDAEAKRLIDFASGLSQGLYGKIERVTNKVFLLSPSHIALSGDQADSGEAEASFFVNS
ncbi:cell division protein SepF [Klugiella xanthotipulae]|uniref:Cell division protein SepF n=1 Tax=Klugiella xanthotipulae TaxID=244735 RepID=A0A543HT78_9MICO|nr:cell division protein SepF [Klugiella xanthotipulae]TQM61469.1 cell division inhibitor SepF [Klugiella xanthotipulae]